MKTVVISPHQRALHMVSQGLAIAAVPFMFYVSENLPTARGRRIARTMAWGSLLVDGYLLYRFLTQTTDEPFL